MTKDQSIKISEIFGPTIQGEGALIGRPTVFVRTGGCDYRCSWCDTLFAVESKYRHDWMDMSAEEVFQNIQKLSGDKPLMVTLSGGNPAIQPLGGLIEIGQALGYQFAIETQGSVAADWFSKLDVLTLSPKPPSSSMVTDYNRLDDCIKAAGSKPQIQMKIVIADEDDFAYARNMAARYPHIPMTLQPCNLSASKDCPDQAALMEKMRWLVEKANAEYWYSVTILPQLHVMLWGNMRGV